jgi:hypothetical protein
MYEYSAEGNVEGGVSGNRGGVVGAFPLGTSHLRSLGCNPFPNIGGGEPKVAAEGYHDSRDTLGLVHSQFFRYGGRGFSIREQKPLVLCHSVVVIGKHPFDLFSQCRSVSKAHHRKKRHQPPISHIAGGWREGPKYYAASSNSRILQTWSVTPAAIAGVMRSVWLRRQKL